jgi:hypothetical protein
MRKSLLFFGILCLSLTALPQVSPDFQTYFLDRTLRVDYFHIGDAKGESITLDRLSQGGVWAGSAKSLADPFEIGRYCVKVFDAAGKTLLYSRGYDAYFGEYKTTDEALKGIQRTYAETALIPFPKEKILFTIEVRDRENNIKPLFKQEIDPANIFIIKASPPKDIKVFDLTAIGDPHRKVDIAILAEGYTAAEEAKVKKDFERFAGIFFQHEPYRSHKDLFNIRGVFRPSEESGISEPSHGSFRRSAMGCTFDSLGSERYILTEDNRAVRDTAGAVPYDAVMIMINATRYGGGGIYNLYTTFTADNQWHEYVFLHEFGHCFGGLADEYYSSTTAYNDFYPKGIEPVEANITALLHPPDVKWKAVVTPGTAIPTPWEKADFDKMDAEYQKVRQEINQKIAKMKREGAPKIDVEKLQAESERLSKEAADRMDAYFAKSKYLGVVGAFEGAGYSSTGLYRPMLDCLMFSKGAKPLCKVCEDHVAKVIRYLTE